MFYWVLLGFTWLIKGFTRFYSRFYSILPGFTGFYVFFPVRERLRAAGRLIFYSSAVLTWRNDVDHTPHPSPLPLRRRDASFPTAGVFPPSRHHRTSKKGKKKKKPRHNSTMFYWVSEIDFNKSFLTRRSTNGRQSMASWRDDLEAAQHENTKDPLRSTREKGGGRGGGPGPPRSVKRC